MYSGYGVHILYPFIFYFSTHQLDSQTKTPDYYPHDVTISQSYLPSQGQTWNYLPSNSCSPHTASSAIVPQTTALNSDYYSYTNSAQLNRSSMSSRAMYNSCLSTQTSQKSTDYSSISHSRGETKYGSGSMHQTVVTYPALVSYPTGVPQLCQRIRGS